MNKTGFFFGVMTGIAAFFACAYFMNTAGCDRTTSPFSGKLATSDEIKSEAESLIRSVAADNEKAQHEAQAKIDGEWKWLCVIKGRVWVCSQDQFTVEGYIAGKELVQWFTQRGLMLNK